MPTILEPRGNSIIVLAAIVCFAVSVKVSVPTVPDRRVAGIGHDEVLPRGRRARVDANYDCVRRADVWFT